MKSFRRTRSRRGDRTLSLPGAFFAWLLLSLCLPSPPAQPAGVDPSAPADAGGGPPVVSVGLSADKSRAHISCAGNVRVWRRGSGLRGTVFGPGVVFRLEARPLESGPSPNGAKASRPVQPRHAILLEVAGDGGPPGRGGHFTETLIFEPLAPEHPLAVDGKPYRGEVLVTANGGGCLGVVNAVGIEDYLKGVVPLEMGSGEHVPLSALQVQAVAARSYTLHYLGRRMESHGCDLLAGPDDQVYGGMEAEAPSASEAVESTRGVVALYENRPIRANYCSTCGGRTESNDRIWEGQQRLPYLRPIADETGGSPLCSASPYFRWEERWSCEELAATVLRHLPQEAPAARGRKMGRLRDLQVTGRSPSGRVEVLTVVTEGGTFTVQGDRIRWVIRRPGGGLLRSTYFEDFERVDEGGCGVRLKGAGYGHGVGLCQFGAIEMGRRGFRPAEILEHYYPGCRLGRWW